MATNTTKQRRTNKLLLACFAVSILLLGYILLISPSKISSAFEFVFSFVFQRKSRHVASKVEQRGLRIIGAEFARTGTKSIETALKMLGHTIQDPCLKTATTMRDGWKQQRNGITTTIFDESIEILLQEMEDAGYSATNS